MLLWKSSIEKASLLSEVNNPRCSFCKVDALGKLGLEQNGLFHGLTTAARATCEVRKARGPTGLTPQTQGLQMISSVGGGDGEASLVAYDQPNASGLPQAARFDDDFIYIRCPSSEGRCEESTQTINPSGLAGADSTILEKPLRSDVHIYSRLVAPRSQHSSSR